MKDYFKQYFVTKYIEKQRYFFGIEVAYQKNDYFLVKKYALDLLQETVYLSANLSIRLWKLMWTFGLKIVKFMIGLSNTGE